MRASHNYCIQIQYCACLTQNLEACGDDIYCTTYKRIHSYGLCSWWCWCKIFQTYQQVSRNFEFLTKWLGWFFLENGIILCVCLRISFVHLMEKPMNQRQKKIVWTKNCDRLVIYKSKPEGHKIHQECIHIIDIDKKEERKEEKEYIMSLRLLLLALYLYWSLPLNVYVSVAPCSMLSFF